MIWASKLSQLRRQFHKRRECFVASDSPTRTELTWDSLPWILWGLVALSKSQIFVQLAFTASGVIGWVLCLTMAPRVRSHRTGYRNKTKILNTQFKSETESRIHESPEFFFLTSRKMEFGKKILTSKDFYYKIFLKE